MIGRAVYWKSDDDAPLPPDLSVISEHDDTLRDVTLVVVEGDRLPSWRRGNTPWEFNTLSALLDYRKGAHR